VNAKLTFSQVSQIITELAVFNVDRHAGKLELIEVAEVCECSDFVGCRS
jgi:acyl CoA:acetate/3-ketoacid CoA transferase beta subunit